MKKDNNIVKNSIELKEFQKLANSILERKQGDIFQCLKGEFSIKFHGSFFHCLVAGGVLICVIVFLYQWHHYAAYRVRVMLRQYRMMLLNRSATEIRKDA